jgi:cytochrome c-type biogenesis protein CcmH
MPRLSLYSRIVGAVLLLALGLAGPAPAQTAEPRTTLPDVEDEVMCPVCGTTLELSSEAAQANDMRDLIRDRIAEGRTKEQIKDELVAEFGPEVLAVPSTEGFDLAAWIVPGLAVLAGAAAALVAVRRWRGASLSQSEKNPPSEGLSGPDTERLDADLKRYEL